MCHRLSLVPPIFNVGSSSRPTTSAPHSEAWAEIRETFRHPRTPVQLGSSWPPWFWTRNICEPNRNLANPDLRQAISCSQFPSPTEQAKPLSEQLNLARIQFKEGSATRRAERRELPEVSGAEEEAVRRKRGGGRDPAIGEGARADLRAVFFRASSPRQFPCCYHDTIGGRRTPPLRLASMGWAETWFGLDLIAADGPLVALSGPIRLVGLHYCIVFFLCVFLCLYENK